MSRVTLAQRAVAFAVVSRLLRYPDDELGRDLPLLREAVVGLPRAARLPLERLLEHLSGRPLLDLQAQYVATFDLRRRNCLYLTYHLSGDTRRRGLAIWRFAAVYRDRGYRLNGGELADYLPAVLELAAEVGPEATAPLDLIVEHRPPIAVLRTSLAAERSPYYDAIVALEAVLPRPDPRILEGAARLADEGPPLELVGLEAQTGREPGGTP
jgi:nitrate reductase delta subunit